MARLHNDANILTLPGRYISEEEAIKCVDEFINTTFEGGRHTDRVGKISKKNYNSDKTFVQISKELHKKVKDHCKKNGLKVKDFLEETILNNLK